MSWHAVVADAEALLFDFDGVIADSEPVFYRTCRDVLRGVGHDLELADYYDRFTCRGLGFAAEVRRAGLGLPDDAVARLEAAWRASYSAAARTGGVPLFPGAIAAVTATAARRPTAIASSSPTEQVRGVLQANGATVPCPIVGRFPGLRPKPAPDVVVYAAGNLGVRPGACVVIEDTVKGLRAAKAVGMRVVIVRTAYTRGPGFEDADGIAERPELMEMLTS